MQQVDLTDVPQSDPTSIYRYRDGLYAADLLTAAIVHLDFFSWLEQRAASLPEICSDFSLRERPVDVMLTLFRAMGLIERIEDRYRNTLMAKEHLVSSSPWFLGPYYASLKERPVCKDFLKVLRTDHPANWGSYQQEREWTKAMEDEAFAQSFTAAMDCRGVYLAQAVAKKVDLSGRKKLLDIAGGSGIYACSLVAHYQELQATVLEKPPVDRVATRAIGQRGYSGRVKVIPGDMLGEDLPQGYDVHLLSNVLHDWNAPTVTELLANSFRTLERGGLLIIHDAHINEAKDGPLPVAAYSAMLMHATEGKCYSLSELFPILHELGFSPLNHIETAADRSVIVASKTK